MCVWCAVSWLCHSLFVIIRVLLVLIFLIVNKISLFQRKKNISILHFLVSVAIIKYYAILYSVYIMKTIENMYHKSCCWLIFGLRAIV
jgi:hypothetical protein